MICLIKNHFYHGRDAIIRVRHKQLYIRVLPHLQINTIHLFEIFYSQNIHLFEIFASITLKMRFWQMESSGISMICLTIHNYNSNTNYGN